jgi:hypothetical protein
VTRLGPKPAFIDHCYWETHDCVRKPVADVITRYDGRLYATPACAFHLAYVMPRLTARDESVIAVRSLNVRDSL